MKHSVRSFLGAIRQVYHAKTSQTHRAANKKKVLKILNFYIIIYFFDNQDEFKIGGEGGQ